MITFSDILTMFISFLAGVAISKLLHFWRWQANNAPQMPICDCSVHDITTPGAAHAVDCPRYD